jgi:D-tyrosyl-tRNA(Tyr) deacylase
MRAVVQRCAWARVLVNGEVVGAIGPGLCVLAGALDGDTQADAQFIAGKLATLRIFPDDAGRINLDVREASGALLLISQFTLAADTTSGTRPSFSSAMAPEQAVALLEHLKAQLQAKGLQVETGSFGEKMLVELANDGPVTIILDSRNKVRK